MPIRRKPVWTVTVELLVVTKDNGIPKRFPFTDILAAPLDSVFFMSGAICVAVIIFYTLSKELNLKFAAHGRFQ